MLRRWRWGRDLRRLAGRDNPLLADYAAAPWPDGNCAIAEVSLLALDFELDGLQKGAHLLQAGWLPFTQAGIGLGEAQSHDIRTAADLDRNAVIVHGIGAQRAASGAHVREVIAKLVPALSGRIMVAHGADIDAAALQGICHTLYGAKLPVRAICTLSLERRLKPNLQGNNAYRLAATRQRYGLPAYGAHDALGDALAAAELLLAQLSHMPENTKLSQLERCF